MKVRKPAVQFEEPGEDAKLDEKCKMEVDEEADSRKKLYIRKKDIAKDMRKLKGVKSWDGACKKVVDEGFKQKELAQIEQRRNDQLPEHNNCGVWS